MKIIIGLVLAAAFIGVYLYWVRPYLKTLPSLAEAWKQEDTAIEALKSWLDGRRTILIGIWGEIVAFLPDALNAAGALDLKTLLMLPDAWAAYVTALIPLLMLIFRAKANG